MQKRLMFFYAIFGITLVILSIYILVKVDKRTKDGGNDNELKTYTEQEEAINQIKEYLSTLPIQKIRVKMTETNEIIEMTMDEYLCGVLPAEMPPYYDIEALKAQAVVARTYAYEKISRDAHSDCDICDSASHCQAYITKEKLIPVWSRRGYDETLREEYFEKIKQAVYDTSSVCIIYNDKLIKAYFHACSGGKTENVSAIWGKQNIAYLISVESPNEQSHPSFTSKVKLSFSELESKLNNSDSKNCNMSYVYDNAHAKILSYTDSGRVDNVAIGGNIYTANELRSLLGLKSTNFTIDEEDDSVTFNVTGYGHGVGMSQIGANAMAEDGSNYFDIVTHYYSGVELVYLVTKKD